MKLKGINIAIVALGLCLPFVTIAATTEGTTTNDVAQKTDLSQPNQSDRAVLAWANLQAVALYTYDFKNYRSEIQKLSGSFTDSGWDQFLSALQKSHNLDAVKAKKLIVSAVAAGAPVILQKSVLNKAYSWRVQMPMVVTYKSPGEFTQQKVVVTMLISRTSSVNAPIGVAISQFVVGPAKSDNKSEKTDQKTAQ